MKRQIYFRKRHRYLSCYYIADESLLIFLYALESPRAIAPHYPYMYRIVVSYTIIPVVVSISIRSPQFQLGSGTNFLMYSFGSSPSTIGNGSSNC